MRAPLQPFEAPKKLHQENKEEEEEEEEEEAKETVKVVEEGEEEKEEEEEISFLYKSVLWKSPWRGRSSLVGSPMRPPLPSTSCTFTSFPFSFPFSFSFSF